MVKIFDPLADDRPSNRKIFYGETSNLMHLSEIKYGWATSIYKKMREDFWIPEKVNLSEDTVSYGLLTEQERTAYDGILSYLTFLDSVQFANIPIIKLAVTAPEVGLAMGEQISQEGLHSSSYQYLIESVIPTNRWGYIYNLHKEDKILGDRCAYIGNIYQKYAVDPTPENLFVSLIANFLLESIYFYNGFQFYYLLASRQLMSGTSDMIRYINRDELGHVRLYAKIINEVMMTKSLPFDRDQIYGMFDYAVQHEIEWTNHIMNNNVLGITSISTDIYTKQLANGRLKEIGLDPLYPEERYKTNPYQHLSAIADSSKEANIKPNFFESTVTNYNTFNVVKNWDF